MREIEGHYEPNTAVIIVASKIHWWMLKLVGGSLGRNKGMENGTDLDWTDHEWCLLAYLSTLLSVIDSQESDSPSWGRHNPCVCSLSQFRNYLSGSTSLTQITLKKIYVFISGCAGSSLMCGIFFSCREQGLPSCFSLRWVLFL